MGEGRGRCALPVDAGGRRTQGVPALLGTNLPRVESVRDPAEVIPPTAPEPTAAGSWGWGGGRGVGAVAVRVDPVRWLWLLRG